MRNPFPAGTVEACHFREEMGEDMRERDIARELDGDTWLDDAIEAARAADALRDYEARAKRAAAPIPQPCHKCTHLFAGAVCNLCGEERPAYTALKAMTRKQEAA